MWRGTCWRIGLGGLCELLGSILDFDMAGEALVKFLEINAPMLGARICIDLYEKCLNVLDDVCWRSLLEHA